MALKKGLRRMKNPRLDPKLFSITICTILEITITVGVLPYGALLLTISAILEITITVGLLLPNSF
jgi:hypothetical protein